MPKFKVGDVVDFIPQEWDYARGVFGRTGPFVLKDYWPYVSPTSGRTVKDESAFVIANLDGTDPIRPGFANLAIPCDLVFNQFLTAVRRAKLKAAQPSRSKRRSTG